MDSKYNINNSKPFQKVHGNKFPTVVKFNDAKRPKLMQGYGGGSTSTVQKRNNLPVHGVRNRLLAEIRKHATVIVIGETGSGKTTQIPQFMHEIRLDKDGMIGITQPRRVAAITLSQRVAQEMNTEIGGIVGYTVRFEDVTSIITKLKYLTDGMLLREAMLDSQLMAYNVIVLDEAHERTVQTDVLFGVVKQAQALRRDKHIKPLKIVVMSATMDVDHFSDYFGGVAILYLEGRQYPVQVYHSLQTQEDFVFSCLVTVFQIHKEAPANHDILVFLTGQEEIEAMAHSIRLIAKDLEGKHPPLKVYPLYSSLPTNQQLDVFRPTPHGARKVILSTNIAETSVTISGIKYVVDSGMVKVRVHHPRTGLDVLKVQRISQAQAWQRTGRAGRESAGFCYRVYTRLEFDSMLMNPVPEIQRCHLTSVVLQLLALGLSPLSFDFMDTPPKESIVEALKELQQLGAVESVDTPVLTSVGRQMSLFPLDPRFSKILLSAKDYGCLEEILSVVALLTSESVLHVPSSKREQAVAAHRKFVSTTGDHLALLNIYKAYSTVNKKKEWCHENFLNARNLAYASDVRSQLAELCRKFKITSSSCGQDTEQVRKCLLTGLYMNIAELQRDRHYLTWGSREVVAIHPSSFLFTSQPQCVVFTEVVQTGRCYLRLVSQVDPQWLTDIAPQPIDHHNFHTKEKSRLHLKMLEPVKHILQSQRIVLASGSPRREEILRGVGLKFEVCPSLYEEDLDPANYKNHGDFVVDTATNKVKEVAERLASDAPDLIIGADTMVSMDGKVYGKPKTEEKAITMLRELSGRAHTVFTGVVLHAGGHVVKFSESTKVFMAPLSEQVIQAYVNTGEPLDKAGAYGIQGVGGSLIEKIEGDYFNVMGMPLHSV
ncbi:hypothetical protein L9F63_012849, partial [Diploptera punctata]